MDDFDRYSLALAVLEREKDAHKLLADLLEESGDRGLAQWSRKVKGSSRKRLDLVLAILPCRVAALLACDFAERAVGRVGRGSRLTALLRSLIEQESLDLEWWPDAEARIRQVAQHPGVRQLAQHPGVRQLAQHPGVRQVAQYPLVRLCLEHLCEAVRHTQLACTYERQSQNKLAMKHADLARQATRRVAKGAYPFHNDPAERDWQLEHVKKTLEKLLQQPAR